MIRTRHLLPCPEDCPSRIYSLMIECWHEVPGRRPSFTEIHSRLRSWDDLLTIQAVNLSASQSVSVNTHNSGSQHSSTGPSNNTGSTNISNTQHHIYYQPLPFQPIRTSHCITSQSPNLNSYRANSGVNHQVIPNGIGGMIRYNPPQPPFGAIPDVKISNI